MFFNTLKMALTAVLFCLCAGNLTAQEAKKAEKGGIGSPLVKKIIEGLQKQESPNIDKAISDLEAGLKTSPKDREAELLLIQLYETSGMRAAQEDEKKAAPYFLKAAKALRTLLKSDKLSGPQEKLIAEMVFYNEACVQAKAGKSDEAMQSLKDCFAAGVDNVSMLSTDKDLDSLRKRDDFKAMVKELTVKAAVEAKKEFAEMIATQKSFKFDFDLKDLDGKKVKLADFKGKYLIVDIWGTWCPPCRAEIPHFIEVLDKYKSKGLEIIGINYEGGDDEKEAIDTIKKFNKTMKVPYNCVIGDEKTQKQVPDFQGYPTTLFLDRSGKVRMTIVGGQPLYRLEAAVEALMDSDKAASDKAGE